MWYQWSFDDSHSWREVWSRFDPEVFAMVSFGNSESHASTFDSFVTPVELLVTVQVEKRVVVRG